MYFKPYFHKKYSFSSFEPDTMFRSYFAQAAGLARDKCRLYGGVPRETCLIIQRYQKRKLTTKEPRTPSLTTTTCNSSRLT